MRVKGKEHSGPEYVDMLQSLYWSNHIIDKDQISLSKG